MNILLSEEQLRNIYLFDGTITETIKAFFKVYKFQLPPPNQIERLTEVIRSNVIEIVDENEKFYLDSYCNNSIYYTRFLIHSFALFSKGYETVTEFYDVDEYIEVADELPPEGIEHSAKILISAFYDYYFDVMEIINNGTLKTENVDYLVRFIIGDCFDVWKDEDIVAQNLFYLIFQSKSYGLAKFMATYLSIFNNEPVRVRSNNAKTSEKAVFDWIFNRGK